MALERFYNLKEEKKKVLFDSIFVAIKKYKYDELTISNITENTDMARTSFYTYFIDKQDAIDTWLMYRVESYVDIFKKGIIDCKGDIICALKKFYLKIKIILEDENIQTIIKNIDFKVKFIVDFAKNEKVEKKLYEIVEIYKLNDYNFNITFNVDDLIYIIDLALQIYSSTIVKYCIESDKTLVDKHFYKELKLIENGIKVK